MNDSGYVEGSVGHEISQLRNDRAIMDDEVEKAKIQYADMLKTLHDEVMDSLKVPKDQIPEADGGVTTPLQRETFLARLGKWLVKHNI